MAEQAAALPLPFQMKIDEALFEARKIFLFGEINQRVAREVTEKLVAISASGADPITLIINSQGGHVEAADTIYDMITYIPAPVRVLGTGWVASAGAHIFLAPELDQRFALPNTRFMLHQPAGGAHGAAVDIGIEAKEIVKMRKRLNRIISERTGQPLDRVEKDTDRNFWMSAEEARDYGILGRIVSRSEDLEAG